MGDFALTLQRLFKIGRSRMTMPTRHSRSFIFSLAILVAASAVIVPARLRAAEKSAARPAAIRETSQSPKPAPADDLLEESDEVVLASAHSSELLKPAAPALTRSAKVKT